MAGDELVDQAVAYLIDAEWIGLVMRAHLCLEHGLQEHIAQFLAHVLAVVGFDRVDVLLGFLEQRFEQGSVRLRTVPRAAARLVQYSHHGLDTIQGGDRFDYRIQL